MLHFADVQPGADLEAERLHLRCYVKRAVDGRRRRIEDCKEAVTCGIDLASTMLLQRRPHDTMVLLDQLAPCLVTQLGRKISRADDVGEQDGGQEPLHLSIRHGAQFRQAWRPGRAEIRPSTSRPSGRRRAGLSAEVQLGPRFRQLTPRGAVPSANG